MQLRQHTHCPELVTVEGSERRRGKRLKQVSGVRGRQGTRRTPYPGLPWTHQSRRVGLNTLFTLTFVNCRVAGNRGMNCFVLGIGGQQTQLSTVCRELIRALQIQNK